MFVCPLPECFSSWPPNLLLYKTSFFSLGCLKFPFEDYLPRPHDCGGSMFPVVNNVNLLVASDHEDHDFSSPSIPLRFRQSFPPPENYYPLIFTGRCSPLYLNSCFSCPTPLTSTSRQALIFPIFFRTPKPVFSSVITEREFSLLAMIHRSTSFSSVLPLFHASTSFACQRRAFPPGFPWFAPPSVFGFILSRSRLYPLSLEFSL